MIDREELKEVIDKYKQETGRSISFVCKHVDTQPAHLSRYLNGTCGMSEYKKREILDFILFDTQAYRHMEENWTQTNNWRYRFYDKEGD